VIQNYVVVNSMCMFKVYLESKDGKKLVADKIVVAVVEDGVVKLYDESLSEKASVKGVIKKVDTLNEVIVIE